VECPTFLSVIILIIIHSLMLEKVQKKQIGMSLVNEAESVVAETIVDRLAKSTVS